MKTWKIPVTWTECGTVSVEADTLEKAMEIAKDDDDVIPIPDNGTYVDGSWTLSTTDIDEVRRFYNGNEPDGEEQADEQP